MIRWCRGVMALLLAIGMAVPGAGLRAQDAGAAPARAPEILQESGDRPPGNAITPPGYFPDAAYEGGYQPPVPLLWKVCDHDSTLWLLGAFHLLKESDYPLSPDIARAFFEAEKLVFELAPEELDGPHTQARFLASALFPDERRLGDVLPPAGHEKLARLLARQGGSIDSVAGYQPWFVNLSLVLGLAHSMGYQPDLGVDRFLMMQAARAGKPVGGLETLEVQLAALAGAPMEEQVRALQEHLDAPEQMPVRLDELHRAWRAGDVARLERLTRLEMMRQTPETYRIVNVERNDAWLERLDAMLRHDAGDALVVVGALHLLGADGLVERLAALGYQVERVCSDC
ncbi:TraB/GumN family protein [Lysobacter sp. GX 14042]|uniref:TraB/GumN family protein n=1 Tax=Lysobacter sp. GX 14042 TaxID=2907155 RepID=UPI001F18D1C6|nr:TraB/GumN family protein [Lysobacter sp. GX 14042]MCE7032638.1 TraB/GumN family protein [Lysobacter sp. GX 14042]